MINKSVFSIAFYFTLTFLAEYSGVHVVAQYWSVFGRAPVFTLFTLVFVHISRPVFGKGLLHYTVIYRYSLSHSSYMFWDYCVTIFRELTARFL